MIRVLTAAQLAALDAADAATDAATGGTDATGSGVPAELDSELATSPSGPRR